MEFASDHPPIDIKFYHKGEIGLEVASGGCKWKGGLKARMDVAASEVWEMVRDFGGIQKWALIAESKLVQGQPNVEGCVRYCKSTLRNPQGEDFWVEERLLAFNREERSMSYAVIGGNMDLQGYVATMRVRDYGTNNSEVEWLFELDPIHGKEESQTVESISLALASKIKHLHTLL